MDEQILQVSTIIEDEIQHVISRVGHSNLEHYISHYIDYSTSDFQEQINQVVAQTDADQPLIIELAFKRTLTAIKKYNHKDLVMFCILFDLSFRCRGRSICQPEVCYDLIGYTLKMLSFSELYKLWPYLEYRTGLLKLGNTIVDGEIPDSTTVPKVVSHKRPASCMVVGINAVLKRLSLSPLLEEDIMLKYKIHSLVKEMFEIYDPLTFNKGAVVSSKGFAKEDTEHNDLYDLYCRVSNVLSNSDVTETVKMLNGNDFWQYKDSLEGLYTKIIDMELHFYAEKKYETHADQEFINKYFTNGKFPELDYSFGHSYKIFKFQVLGSPYFRKRLLIECLWACDFVSLFENAKFDSLFGSDVTLRVGPAAKEVYKVMKTKINELYEKNDPYFFKILQSILSSEQRWIGYKVGDFKEFNTKSEPVVVEVPDLDKSLPAWPWMKMGHKKIHELWKVSTGLENVVRVDPVDVEQILAGIENDDDYTVDKDNAERETWQKLRQLSARHVFKFSQVNEDTGLRGLLDSTLIQENHKKRKAEEDAEQEALYTKASAWLADKKKQEEERLREIEEKKELALREQQEKKELAMREQQEKKELALREQQELPNPPKQDRPETAAAVTIDY